MSVCPECGYPVADDEDRKCGKCDEGLAPIMRRTPGERTAYLSGYGQAVRDVATHGLEFARTALAAASEVEALTSLSEVTRD